MTAKNLKKELRIMNKKYIGCNGFPITNYCYNKFQKVLYLMSDSQDENFIDRGDFLKYCLRHVWDGATVVHHIDTDNIYDVVSCVNLYSFDY